ncbi:hypothetical protein [Paenibacillus macquariensis]|uniref:Uncharacterized protein n=1 Tax=Paenibacillus macquariensis TaxID=948756 RepID=A0ABY1KC16_9BACL|nr:hypothetical protein [Paenibacillus macquariensis]MEC0093523.1 hypothetical protein [Paenibacillus macquariensis]OAB29868.1 hypothetical protein PMSM_23280 [Paenibacillus macquariensis subsp. macquariensis]SIR56919.1 hypothetical protein SAMN05421578_11953 [Paenibacillus macquariensis]
MNRTMSVLRMHAKNKMMWVYVPIFILCINFAVNLLISLLLIDPPPMYTGGIIQLYVYMFVMGIIIIPQSFPLALGLSVSRKNYFLGTTSIIILVSTAFAFLWCITAQIEQQSDYWGGNLHFFTIPYLNDGTVFEQFCIYFILMMNFYYVGLVISSVHRRYGNIGLLVLFICCTLLLGIGGFAFYYYQWWITLIRWLNDISAFHISLWMIPFGLCCAMLSYLLLRKSTV